MPLYFGLGSGKVTRLMSEEYEAMSTRLKLSLEGARKITLCLDGWTKKGLSASYLGVSACYFDPVLSQPRHATLNLFNLEYPHTGVMIADCLQRCIQHWSIPEEKIHLIVSDSGSNMIKAIKTLRANHIADCEEGPVDEREEEDEGEHEDDEGNHQEEDESTVEQLQLPQHVVYRRMPCMAHTLQLIIKPVYAYFDPLLTKTRHLVGRIRKSSVAVEKLVQKCGKSVVSDCTTRWNSTFMMISRLLAIKNDVTEVLTAVGKYEQ